MRMLPRVLLAATMMMVARDGVAVAQVSDAELVRRAASGATEMLEKAMLHRGNHWYASFTLATTTPEERPQPVFVETLKPKTEPRVEEGLIEVEFLSPPRGTMTPSGSVAIRSQIFKYRIWRPGTGWGPKTTIIANSFEWDANLVAGKMNIKSVNDARFGTSDCGVTGLLSQVFSLKVEEVKSRKADARHRALPAETAPGPDPRLNSPIRSERRAAHEAAREAERIKP
jgi:hypothetical protein